MINSRLYLGSVMHQRLSPKQHGFRHNLFMFYFDLDELETLDKKLLFFSRNRFNWFTFRDRHHVQSPQGTFNSKTIKQNVVDYLQSKGGPAQVHRVTLLTQAAVWGYAFNPISVYFCFDQSNQPLCAMAEVCNTHGEMKVYLLNRDAWNGKQFELKIPKNFYVSPFSEMDATFHFIFPVPGDDLHIRVDDYKAGNRFLVSSLTGTSRPITNGALLGYGLRFPFITLKIIFLIHWHALLLRLRGLTFRSKQADLHLQQNMFHYK